MTPRSYWSSHLTIFAQRCRQFRLKPYRKHIKQATANRTQPQPALWASTPQDRHKRPKFQSKRNTMEDVPRHGQRRQGCATNQLAHKNTEPTVSNQHRNSSGLKLNSANPMPVYQFNQIHAAEPKILEKMELRLVTGTGTSCLISAWKSISAKKS